MPSKITFTNVFDSKFIFYLAPKTMPIDHSNFIYLPYDSGTPSTPKRPRVIRSDCQSVSVSWTAPRSNGGHSVSSYMLRYRPVGSDSRVMWQAVPLSSDKMQTTLTGLSPGQTYLLSMSASNIVGTSPYSESTVAPTNPPGKGCLVVEFLYCHSN